MNGMRGKALVWCMPVLLPLAGCSWLDDPSPEFVRVTIDGGDESLMLITSTQFFQTTNDLGQVGVEVISSDTTIASFPFDESWDIRAEQRFLLLGLATDSTEIDVRVRVLLDGDADFDRAVTISIDTPVRYIYLFNQQIIQDFELF